LAFVQSDVVSFVAPEGTEIKRCAGMLMGF